MNHLSDLQPESILSYLIAFLFPALDAVLPVLPSGPRSSPWVSRPRGASIRACSSW